MMIGQRTKSVSSEINGLKGERGLLVVIPFATTN